MALEWKSALFVSPGKGGTAQCGLPRRGVGGGCWVNGMTSGGECWKVPLLVNTVYRGFPSQKCEVYVENKTMDLWKSPSR